MNKENLATEIKKKQLRNLAIVLGILGAIFFLFFLVVADKPKAQSQDQIAHFASPLKHVDAESVLISKTESRLTTAEKNTEDLKKEVDKLSKEKEDDTKQPSKEGEDVKALTNRIAELEKKIAQGNTVIPDGKQNFTGTLFPPPSDQDTRQASGQQPLMAQGIRDDVIISAPVDVASVPLKNPETYVPAGTFAKAVALGGADASAAVNAQSNPIPMLFRIIEDGTMPNNEKSHLKGCLATAAVVGDISSERGLIRLETLSCIDKDSSRIVDIAVEGTVFGPEGKNGVRGIPMWREGALLQRAFLAGTLSGLASGITQRYTTNSISPLGNTQTVNNSDIFKYGAANGVSNAMSKLADYNIQRAEQYHPVLQLSAGTTVDLVFLKGFYLDGLKHDETKQGDVNLNAVPVSDSTASGTGINNITKLPFTPEQMERLKAHEAELKD